MRTIPGAALLVVGLTLGVLSGCASQSGNATRSTATDTSTPTPTGTGLPPDDGQSRGDSGGEATTTATVVATPKSSPTLLAEPTVWDVARTMLDECSGSPQPAEYDEGQRFRYFDELVGAALAANPSLGSGFLPEEGMMVSAENGTNSSPFGWLDLPFDAPEPEVNMEAACELFVVFYSAIPENVNGDGILAGEAYLFYEVGGGEPFALDGELREVQFSFNSDG